MISSRTTATGSTLRMSPPGTVMPFTTSVSTSPMSKAGLEAGVRSGQSLSGLIAVGVAPAP